MVWIRRVRTASGATAVQIAESVDDRRRIIRHVGSARDDAELGLLIEEAHRLLADDTQRRAGSGDYPESRSSPYDSTASRHAVHRRCRSILSAGVGCAATGAQEQQRAAL